MESKNLLHQVSITFEQILSHISVKRPEDKWIYESRAKYYERVFRAKERGEILVWHSLGAIPELLWAMDMVPMSPEVFFAVLSALPGGTTDYLDIAQRFVPLYICAANKAPLGVLIAGHIPKPDIIIHSNQPCGSGLISFPALADYFGIPSFCLDIPYWDDEPTYEYIAGQLERLIIFLEEKMGRKRTWIN